jgi:hypothetical protein
MTDDADRLEAVLATVPDPTDRAWLRRVLEGLAAQCAAPDTPASRFPFKLEIAGQTVVGVLETESELAPCGLSVHGEQMRAPRTALVEPAAEAPIAEPQRGRPSFDSTIAEAAEALGAELDACRGPAERARCVLRHLTNTCDPASLPRRRTVEAFLAKHWRPVRKKDRKKGRKKSPVVYRAPVRR